MREQDITKLEFLMMVNDNIIVQRYFNVRDYNPDTRNSVDFKEFMDDLIDNLNYAKNELLKANQPSDLNKILIFNFNHFLSETD